MCCAASIARRKVGNWQMPSSLRGLIGMQRQLDRRGEGQRAFRSHQQPRQVLLPGEACDRRQHLDVVAADAAELRGEPRGDLLGLGRTERAQPLDQFGNAASARRRRDCPAAGRNCAACRRPGSRRSRAHCRPSARSGSTSSRRSCCRPCRRSCSAHAWRDRPGRTTRAGRSAAFRWPSTRPGSTRRCALGIDVEDAAQMLRAVDHQRAVYGLAALARAAAARQHGDAFLARDGQRRGDVADRPPARSRRSARTW